VHPNAEIVVSADESGGIGVANACAALPGVACR
jgi:hypothetical protein